MSRLSRILTMALLATAAGTWTLQTLERERLTQRIDRARVVTRQLARAEAEHDQLQRRQPFLGEIETLRRDRAEMARLRREVSQREQAADPVAAARAAVGREVLPSGLWLPTELMPDLGRATPHAALQTLCWAAARGEVAALQELITFEPGAREAAERAREALPDSLRHEPAEALLAHSLVQRPPSGELRMLAEHFRGFDDVTVFLARREAASAPVRSLFLRFRWEPGGWRVAVPHHAVKNAAALLAGDVPEPAADMVRGFPRLPEP